MIKLTFITQALSLISNLFKGKTPQIGEEILNGAKEVSKIGHLLNTVTGTILSGIALTDMELLYSWWEKDKVFFVLTMIIIQAPYVISAYMKAVGKGQVEEVKSN